MNKGNQKKAERLGMPYGTAMNRLRKDVLFSLVQECKKDTCFRCGKKIENVENFSIEHKEAWLNSENPIEKFYDINNIAFSHISCNISASEKDVEEARKKGRENALKRNLRNGLFSEDDIRTMRQLLKTKKQCEVAKMYGISKFTMYRIANGLAYGYVE